MIYYRFRSTNRLLKGNEELSKQTIFFAHPESLNDPMEGYREIYWSGDNIAWKNLFRHYLLTLERTITLSLLHRDDEIITTNNIPIHISMDDLPTPEAKDYFQQITDTFFKNKNISLLLNAIISRTTKIKTNELICYLSCIHPLAVETILQKYEEIKIIPKRPQNNETADQAIESLIGHGLIEGIEKLIKEHTNTDKIESIFSAQRNAKSQILLLSRYNLKEEIKNPNKQFIIQEFPENYAKLLPSLIYPEWYTACFMSSCENSSVWGHYGDNHKGVCLIFESTEDHTRNTLSVKGVTGWGTNGPHYGDIKLTFEKIDYKEGFGEIDFFRSLGHLTRQKLNSTWHSLDGEFSICAKEMNECEEEWRNLYWQQFYRDIKVKSPDWHYENEHRLILCDMLGSHSAPKDRALTYDFSSLKGIIFGINTSTDDKIEIIRIIAEKCTNSKRKDFKFYQAYYSAQHKCIKHTELSLIKYSEPTSNLG